VLVQQFWAAGSQDRSKHEGDDDRVVELPGDGDEIDGHREVADQRGEQQLAAAWNSVVGE